MPELRRAARRHHEARRDRARAGIGTHRRRSGENSTRSTKKGKSRATARLPTKVVHGLPSTRAGQLRKADKANRPLPARDLSEAKEYLPPEVGYLVPSTRAGQAASADKARHDLPARDELGQDAVAAEAADIEVPSDAGQSPLAAPVTTRVPASPFSAALDELAELQVRRKFYIGITNKQTNAAKALVRRYLGWHYDSDEGDREKLNAQAARVVGRRSSATTARPSMVRSPPTCSS